MALTFTCSVSIANARATEVKQLLIAALSCNLAWGIVDAIMYMVSITVKRSRNHLIYETVRESENSEKGKRLIAAELPPVIASVITADEYEKIRIRVQKLPEERGRVRITIKDVKKAIGLFLIVFFSTFPVVIPFVVFTDAMFALRVSNLIAIAIMFACGWSVANYVGMNKWRMSFGMVFLGVILVLITIGLGG